MKSAEARGLGRVEFRISILIQYRLLQNPSPTPPRWVRLTCLQAGQSSSSWKGQVEKTHFSIRPNEKRHSDMPRSRTRATLARKTSCETPMCNRRLGEKSTFRNAGSVTITLMVSVEKVRSSTYFLQSLIQIVPIVSVEKPRFTIEIVRNLCQNILMVSVEKCKI